MIAFLKADTGVLCSIEYFGLKPDIDLIHSPSKMPPGARRQRFRQFKRLGSQRDTGAAGDSFNAGVLAEFAMDAPPAPLVEKAANILAKVIQARGALVKI